MRYDEQVLHGALELSVRKLTRLNIKCLCSVVAIKVSVMMGVDGDESFYILLYIKTTQFT